MTALNSNINMFAQQGKAALFVPHSGEIDYNASSTNGYCNLTVENYRSTQFLEDPNWQYIFDGVAYSGDRHSLLPLIGPSSVAHSMNGSIMHMSHENYVDLPSTGDAVYTMSTGPGSLFFNGYVYHFGGKATLSEYNTTNPYLFVPNAGIMLDVAFSGTSGIEVIMVQNRLFVSGFDQDDIWQYSMNPTRADEAFRESRYTWTDDRIQTISTPLFEDRGGVNRGRYYGDEAYDPDPNITVAELYERDAVGSWYPLLTWSFVVSGDPNMPPMQMGDVKIMAMELSQYGEPQVHNSGLDLVLCGSETNTKLYQYDNVVYTSYDEANITSLHTQEFKRGSSLRWATEYDIDTHYKLNEGSGTITFSADGNNTGTWLRGHAGDPHWVHGEDSESDYDPMHVSFYRDTGEGVFGIDLQDQYQRAVRLGKIGENIDSTFKFTDSAPTGDFTIFINLTHSGHTNGNILQFIDSGRPLATNYADFRIYGGSGTYNFEIYESDGTAHGSTVTVPSAGGLTRFGDKNVRPCIIATYGGSNNRGNIYVLNDPYHTPINSGNPIHVPSRRIVNSGDLYMPGIPGSFGLDNGPNYYEEFGILNRYLEPADVYEFAHAVRHRENVAYERTDPDIVYTSPFQVIGNILRDNSNPVWPGFDTTDKRYLEFDVPTYSGYTKEFFHFLAPNWQHHDSGSLFNLDNNGGSLKIKSFIQNTTSNPSGVEVIFSSNDLDWSGHPVLLPSGQHYIEVTGSFPNNARIFNQINGTGLADYQTSVFAGPAFRCDLKNIGQGNNYYTANTKIYGIEVEYSGQYKPGTFAPAPTGVPLFIEGVFVESSGIDLFTFAEPTSGYIPLHTKAGHINTINPGNTLFVHGHTDNSSSGTLFVEGHITVSGDTTLYINGIFSDSQSMNLYVKGDPPGYSSGNVPLYALGAAVGEGNGFKTTTLFTKSFDNPYPSGNMNLFLSVNPTETNSITNTMNLFMKGLGDESGFQTFSNNLNLFINNDAVAANSGVPMFINQQTASNASGYIPVSGFMNLFINRQFESVAHNLPMFINGPSGDNNSINLFMQAQPNDRSGVSMYIDGIGVTNNPTELYTHGF